MNKLNLFRIPGMDGVNLLAEWITDPSSGEVIGLHARHERPEQFPECSGGGYIAWVQTSATPAARHQLVAGSPDDLTGLTISPSLWHRAKGEGNSPHRGCHGFIRSGRWEVV